jgi:hypothetical protein
VEPQKLIAEGRPQEPVEHPAQEKNRSEDKPKKKMGF